MAIRSYDTFLEPTDQPLSLHIGQREASWTEHSASAGDAIVIADDRLISNSASGTLYYASGVPDSADYDVLADLYVATLTEHIAGLVGRCSTSAETYYALVYYNVASTAVWVLFQVIAGSATTLGTYAQSLTAGNTYAIKLEMRGTSIKCYIDGVELISATDSGISAAGRGGILFNAGAGTSSTGLHLDNFRIVDLAQVAQLVQDLLDGNFVRETGSQVDLYASVDEPYPPSTADYIEASPLTSPDTVRLGLGALSDPATSNRHYVRYLLGLNRP